MKGSSYIYDIDKQNKKKNFKPLTLKCPLNRLYFIQIFISGPKHFVSLQDGPHTVELN